MLLLVFHIGDDRFGFDVHSVHEVTPLVKLKKVPQAPEFVAGLFYYYGSVVPVIDLSTLMAGTQSRKLISTRIILVNFTTKNEQQRLLGLMAERVFDTVHCSEDEFQPPGIDSENAPYLGAIIPDEHGMIQLITLEKLLPESLLEILYTE